MIKLTAERTNWYVFPQDETGETKVEIRHLKPGEIAEIETQSNRVVGRHSEEGFNTEVDFNFMARSQAILKKSIVTWEGFEEINGRPMKCTDTNKLKLMKEFDWFFNQIEEFREDLAATVEKEKEEAEGN